MIELAPLQEIETYRPVEADNKPELDKELDKLFRFFVKHYDQANISTWKNRDIRKFIKWAWLTGNMFVVHDPTSGGRRIAAAGVGLLQKEPTVEITDLSCEASKDSQYVYAYAAAVHPNYNKSHMLFLLATMAQWRYRDAKFFYWESHARGSNKTIVVNSHSLLRRLAQRTNSNGKE